MAITILLALVLSLVLALAGPVSASPPSWNVTGTWVFIYGEGTSYGSNYDLTLTQTGAALNGSAGYPVGSPPIPYQYTFSLTTGLVSGNAISWTAIYSSTVNSLANGCTLTVTGTIAPDGTMSGTWTDNYPSSGGSRTGNWKTTSGQATPMPNIGNMVITGNVVAPTITVTPPPPIDFGLLKLGSNLKASSGNGGLAIDLGSANSVTWQITAQDVSTNQGHLAISSSVYLADELTIGKDTSSLWFNADGSSGVLTYTGGYNGSAWTGDALSFAAGQTVLATDPAGDGFYTTITFTATITTEN
jgi:hypothetical protein